jgi:hypothetical protein
MSMFEDELVGPCPLQYNAHVEVITNGLGIVRFVISACNVDNLLCAGYPEGELEFVNSETNGFNYTNYVSESGIYEFNFHVIEPNDETFGPLKFDVTCTQ